MKLVLFDFDGTLTTQDTYTRFILQHTNKLRLVIGGIVLAPLILLNKLKLMPSNRLRPIVSKLAFTGVSEEVVAQKARLFVQEYLPSVMRADAIDKLHQYKAEGHRIVVVSATISPYLTLWCTQMGVDCICSKLEIVNGCHTGRYSNGDCSGIVKATSVLQTYDLNSFTEVIAYGDTPEDHPMLELADVSFYRGKHWVAIKSQ